MKNLSKRNQELILDGLKTCGLNENLDAYYYIGEKLYMNEENEIKKFIFWLFLTKNTVGYSNIKDKWKEFKKSN